MPLLRVTAALSSTASRATNWVHLLTPTAVAHFWHESKTHESTKTTLVDFDLDDNQAVAVFNHYQKQRCHQLHATDIIQPGQRPQGYHLPFWLFQVTVSAECKATLGHRADKTDKNSPLSWAPMAEWKAFCEQQTFASGDPDMQVFASYQLRRDLAEAAKLDAAHIAKARQLSPEELQLVTQQMEAQEPPRSSNGSGSGHGESSKAGSGGATPAYEGSSRAGRDSSNNNDGSKRQGQPGGASETRSSSQAGPGASSSTSSSGSSSSSSPMGGMAGSVGTAQGVASPVFAAPDMRRSIAWMLCYRRLKHALIQDALQWLRTTYNADDVKSLQVNVKLLRRSSSLAFFPAYHFSYTYGVKYTPSRAEIIPQHFEALVGGTQGGKVAAELHLSSGKAQAASAAAIATAVGGVGLGAEMLAGVDVAGMSLGMVDAAFAAFIAASGAGAFAKAVPRMARNKHVADQVRLEKEFYRQYDQRESGPHEPPDAHTLWLWMDQDWRRWESDDPWNWDPDMRKQWAEDLLRQQGQREREKERFHIRQQQQRERQEANEESERQRQQKYGRSRHHRAHEHMEGGHTSSPKRRKDFLGYYKIMNMDPEGELSSTLIKQAFKRQALQLHPDRQAGATEAQLRAAAERFRRLQVAYEVLKDPKRRKAYDAGRLVQ